MQTRYLSVATTDNKYNKELKTNCSKLWALFSILLLSLTCSSSFAHRGSPNEVDNCRIKVGFEKIHFTAYTPTFTQSRGYCQLIPNVGQTNLVFDYEGKKLRNVTIEFEVTKEPEGTRVYYQEPKKIKSGTVNASVDFSKFGAGDYLAHITIVHKEDKLDSHLPFSIGVEKKSTPWGLYIFSLLILVALVFFIKSFLNKEKNTQNTDTKQSE